MCLFFFVFSSRRRHTRCALVTGVQTCALPISSHSVPHAIPLAVLLIIYILATKRRFVKPNWRARTQPSESSAQGRNDENLAFGAADQRIDSCGVAGFRTDREPGSGRCFGGFASRFVGDRTSTRLNSSQSFD